MKKFYQNKNLISVLLSVVLTFAFVVIVVDAATTISTNINTAGTLTVTGTHALIGTTTQSGLSVLTLEATSTDAIPLTLRGYNGQTEDLLRIHNVGGTELFAIDFAGNASTTVISVSDNISINGNATTTSAGNISSEGTLTVSGLTTLGYASTTAVSASDNININGNATTTSNGNFATVGTITAVGNFTTDGQMGIGTTTLTYPMMINQATTSIAAPESANASSTLYIYQSGGALGGQIILEDTDGAGCSVISILDGTIKTDPITCPAE